MSELDLEGQKAVERNRSRLAGYKFTNGVDGRGRCHFTPRQKRRIMKKIRVAQKRWEARNPNA